MDADRGSQWPSGDDWPATKRFKTEAVPLHPVKSPILCQFFERGECTHGAECLYSHGPEDSRAASKAIAASKAERLAQLDLRQAEPASGPFAVAFARAGVPLGGASLGIAPAPSPALGLGAPPDAAGSGGRLRSAVAFKSVYCRFYDSGRCHRGAACAYAHGLHELRGSVLGPDAALASGCGTALPAGASGLLRGL